MPKSSVEIVPLNKIVDRQDAGKINSSGTTSSATTSKRKDAFEFVSDDSNNCKTLFNSKIRVPEDKWTDPKRQKRNRRTNEYRRRKEKKMEEYQFNIVSLKKH